jgi:hypothetical protein
MFATSRTWVEYDRAKPLLFLFCNYQATGFKSVGKSSYSAHVREVANIGHPSRGQGLVAAVRATM